MTRSVGIKCSALSACDQIVYVKIILKLHRFTEQTIKVVNWYVTRSISKRKLVIVKHNYDTDFSLKRDGQTNQLVSA